MIRNWPLGMLIGSFCLLASAGTINYTYNSAGRIIGVDYGAGNTTSYVYDNAGNLRLLSSPRPGLLIGPVITNQFTLSWPAAPAGFLLETSPSLGPGALWTTNIGATPALQGDFVTVTLPVGASVQFYRLHKP